MSILDRILPHGLNEDENYPYFLSKKGRKSFFKVLLWLHLFNVVAVLALVVLILHLYQPPNSPNWIVGAAAVLLFAFVLAVSLLVNLYTSRVNASLYRIVPGDLLKLVREVKYETEDPVRMPYLIGIKVLETVEVSHKEYKNRLEGYLDMKVEHLGFQSLSWRRKLVTVVTWTVAIGIIFMGGAMIFGFVEPISNPTNDPRITRLNSRESDLLMGFASVMIGALVIYMERTLGRLRHSSYSEEAIDKLIKESQDS